MKKLISTILISTMLIVSPIYGSDIDITTMETEELITLKSAIETELSNRGETNERLEITSATYVVGEDINPGQYKIEYSDDDNYFDVRIYKDVKSYDNNAYSLEEGLVNNLALRHNQSASFKLKDNQVVWFYTSGPTPGFLSKQENSSLLN